VTHRNAPVYRRALDPDMDQQLAGLKVRTTDYEGPTAFATALLHAAAAASLPAASLWVATPPYLQSGNPVAALALLEIAAQVTGLPLGEGQLQEPAESFQNDVESALREHPELAEQLKEMMSSEALDDEVEETDGATGTQWKGPDPDRPPPDAPPGLPTGKSLVDAVEKYLKQTRGGDAPPSGG
jgi:hypothetical protein